MAGELSAQVAVFTMQSSLTPLSSQFTLSTAEIKSQASLIVEHGVGCGAYC